MVLRSRPLYSAYTGTEPRRRSNLQQLRTQGQWRAADGLRILSANEHSRRRAGNPQATARTPATPPSQIPSRLLQNQRILELRSRNIPPSRATLQHQHKPSRRMDQHSRSADRTILLHNPSRTGPFRHTNRHHDFFIRPEPQHKRRSYPRPPLLRTRPILPPPHSLRNRNQSRPENEQDLHSKLKSPFTNAAE